MSASYHKRVLRVNLTTSSIDEFHPTDDWYRMYFGGRGFVAYHVFKEVPAGADPLGPENKLVFACGPLTGLPIAGAARHSIGAKSPLTGRFGEAEAGGHWGAVLKRAGFDALIVEGKAPDPVYLYVHDGRAELRPAHHFVGRSTGYVDAAIRQEIGPDVRIAQIGPAGENMVKFACVTHDLGHFAGRCGLGAVMGSKRLRAVVVRGTNRVPMANEEPIRRWAKWMNDNWRSFGESMRALGTPALVTALNALGGLPTRNFRQGQFEGAESLSGERLRDAFLDGGRVGTCFGCPIGCKRVMRSNAVLGIDGRFGGPEYETLAALGSNCGVSDLAVVCKANQLAAELGLDTISTGAVIAFAMECFESGLITKAETGGLDLTFGNGDAVLELMELIAAKRGLGALLANGVREAAKELGPQAEQYALHVKGQEIPMHEPRLKHGLGLGYLLSPTGADHCHNLHDTAFSADTWVLRGLGILFPLPVNDLSAAKVKMYKYMSAFRSFCNSATLCNNVRWVLPQIEDLVRAATGWEDVTAFEFMQVGLRNIVLAWLFNLREGMAPEDFSMPSRFLRPFSTGPLAGVAMTEQTLARARSLYFQMMGFDSNGVPSEGALVELGLEWAGVQG